MKQETLEEAAESYANDWEEIHPELDSDNITPIAVSKIDFIKGAKWQAERMYIEIEQKWLEYRSNTNNEDAWCFKEWLVEQFK